MSDLVNKFILLLVSFVVVITANIDAVLVALLLFSIVCSSLETLFIKNEVMVGIVILLFSVVSMMYKELIFFMPIIVYDVYSNKKLYPLLIVITFIYLLYMPSSLLSLLLSVVSLTLSFYTRRYEQSKELYYQSQNDAREYSLAISSKNQHLIERRDYEVAMATLKERNRIARDIHDNVGHLITRSIMQMKALEITCEHDSFQIQSVSKTLVEAMETIRQSVHHIHDDSINIKIEIEKLTSAFDFCPVLCVIEGEDLPINVRYCFLSIVKEALSNTAKHSNATSMTITIIHHPGFYQLICKDNGRSINKINESGGIGLRNIRDRAESSNGVVSITNHDGFVIFVSIPVIN